MGDERIAYLFIIECARLLKQQFDDEGEDPFATQCTFFECVRDINGQKQIDRQNGRKIETGKVIEGNKQIDGQNGRNRDR